MPKFRISFPKTFFIEFFWRLLDLFKKVAGKKRYKTPQPEFKEFETRLKYSWSHLKLYLMFQNLRRRSIETGFLAGLRRGSNLLNSDSGCKDIGIIKSEFVAKTQFL